MSNVITEPGGEGPPTPFQPTLPPEGDFTNAELMFMEEEPPGLFPANQDSNFGWVIRKNFSDFVQELQDDQLLIYNERFVDTSTQFIDQWEWEVGLPPNPSGVAIAGRRQNVLARLQRGPFTRPRRDAIIEAAINATFGNPIILTPPGVAMDPAGVPLYTESGDVSTLYKVVENIPGYSYQVRIKNTITPDIPSLTRELERITPAGISFTIVSVAVP